MSDEGSSQSWDDTNCGHTERYQGVCLTCGHREDAGRGQTHDERCACREYVNGWCIDCGQRELSSGRGQSCPGHYPACHHREDFIACDACIERRQGGPLFCADLDNCGGPGCMDEVPSGRTRTSTEEIRAREATP